VVHHGSIEVPTRGKGLYEITDRVEALARQSGINTGLVNVFVQHTSASLVIQENADPDVQRDLKAYFERLVPEDDDLYVHTMEGPDDMPAHVRSALTAVNLTVPWINGKLGLGTWQGIYLFEHRRSAHLRRLVVSVLG
jgi:secondary thiamine-phosphate synthase enzyme